MAGQDPYRPFENDRLPWRVGSSEEGRPFLLPPRDGELEFRQPAILVFVAARDATGCCAANYERFVFRDKKVVELTKQAFVAVRVDRAALGKEELEAWGLKAAQPALLVTDCEGQVAARWDACTSASTVYPALLQVLRRSRTKLKVGEAQKKALEEVAELVATGAYREARHRLQRLLRDKDGPLAGRRRVELELQALTARGQALFAEAQGLEEPLERYARLIVLREEFWHDTALVGDLKAAVKALEEGEQTKGPVREWQAGQALAAAKAQLEKGKTSQGREALRQLQRDFPGTAAAAEATELLR